MLGGAILSLCDYTGNWSRPYEELGYRVIRVDLKTGNDVRLMPYLDEPIRDHGDPYTKKTLLWGQFRAPRKSPVEPIRVNAQGSWIQSLGGKSERTKELRSATPMGFARAFAEANP